MRLRDRRGLIAACLLVGCVHVPVRTETVSRGIASATSIGTTFTVVVWNVHKERDAFEDELPTLAPHPELILLQEGVGPVVGAPLAGQGRATHVVSFRRVRGGAMTGVLTWSPVAATEQMALRTEAREPLVRTPKSALLSVFPLEGGGALSVVNLHGINLRTASRLETQLRTIERALQDRRGPLIVAGDFNTWSEARHAVLDRFAARLGLRRVFSGPDAPKLDGVLVRGLQVDGARVVDTHHSDHDALVVRLRVGVA